MFILQVRCTSREASGGRSRSQIHDGARLGRHDMTNILSGDVKIAIENGHL